MQSKQGKPFLLNENDFYDKCELINEDYNGEKKLYLKGIFQEAGIRNQNGRSYPENVLFPEIERYAKRFVYSKPPRSVGELDHPSCIFDKSFQILTKDGWKQFEDISEDEQIFTLNPETHEMEVHQITKKIYQEYSGKAIHIKGRSIDLVVTPNHRFISYDRYNKPVFVTAQQLLDDKLNETYITSMYRIPKLANWFGENKTEYTLKGLITGKKYKTNHKNYENDIQIDMKVFMGFLGIWLAEGWCSKDKDMVFISQRKPETIEMIRHLLSQFPLEMKWSEKKELFGTINFYLTDPRLTTILKPLGKAKDKYIPFEFKQLEPQYLEELLYWFNLGDGRSKDYSQPKSKSNMKHVFSISSRLIDDLHEILIKSGGCGNITVQVCTEDYWFDKHLIKKENKNPLYVLNYATTKDVYLDMRFLDIHEEEISGFVKCVSVPNETFYARVNGKAFWSGNSPSINLERISHRIVELKIEGSKVWGKALIGGPKGETVKKILDLGVQLGVSSRSLGTLDMNNRVNELQIITWDIVHEPSVSSALMENIVENISYEWLPDKPNYFQQFSTLKEDFINVKKDKSLSKKEKQIVFKIMFEQLLSKLK